MATANDALATASVSRVAAAEQQAADPSQPRFAHGDSTATPFSRSSDAPTAAAEVATLR